MKVFRIIGGLLLMAALVGGAIGIADAATAQNINTHGAICNPYNASQALDIDYLTSGVRTIASSARPVICAVPRHPVTGPTQSFYVDGSNSAGASTSCSLWSYNFNGVFQSSTSFTATEAVYDRFVTLASNPFYAYTSLLCTLPANGGGVLFGITALDN